jgi:hypothetical protein
MLFNGSDGAVLALQDVPCALRGWNISAKLGNAREQGRQSLPSRAVVAHSGCGAPPSTVRPQASCRGDHQIPEPNRAAPAGQRSPQPHFLARPAKG